MGSKNHFGNNILVEAPVYLHIIIGIKLFAISNAQNCRTKMSAQKLTVCKYSLFVLMNRNIETIENIGINSVLMANEILPMLMSPIFINGCVAINIMELTNASNAIKIQLSGILPKASW